MAGKKGGRPRKDAIYEKLEYFSRNDFACDCGMCDGVLVDPDMIRNLEKLAGDLKIDLAISQGARCEHYVSKNGGKGANHLVRNGYGRAVDVICPQGMELAAFLQRAAEFYSRIGIGPEHVHLERGPLKTLEIFWLDYGDD